MGTAKLSGVFMNGRYTFGYQPYIIAIKTVGLKPAAACDCLKTLQSKWSCVTVNMSLYAQKFESMIVYFYCGYSFLRGYILTTS